MDQTATKTPRTKHTAFRTAPTDPALSIRETILLSTNRGSRKNVGSGPDLDLFFHELTGLQSRLKRPLDVAVGLVGTMTLAILFPIIWAGIKLSTKGSAIVREQCTGYYGNSFRQLKFRTGSNGRVSRFGTFLEITNLDLLPSFINILKGEMSLVGPAAIRQQDCLRLNSRYSDFYKRFAVKPGLVHINGIPKEVKSLPDETYIYYQLKNELDYISRPSLKKDFSTLLHRLVPEK